MVVDGLGNHLLLVSYLAEKLLAMRITILLVLGFLVNVSCQTTNVGAGAGETVTKYLLDIKNEFAPDRRVAIWDVSHRGSDPIILYGETNLPAAKNALSRKLKKAQINFIDSLHVLNPSPALVNISVCNIRSQPKHSAELSTQSIMGTPLSVYKKQGSWHYVQTPEGYLGWLDNGGLVLMQKAEMRSWHLADKLVVDKPFATVKSADSRRVVSDVTEGNILKKIRQRGEFIEVALPDGRSGLIQNIAKCKTTINFSCLQNLIHENIVSTAMDFIGRPYLVGWYFWQSHGLQWIYQDSLLSKWIDVAP